MIFDLFKAFAALSFLSLKGDGKKAPQDHGIYSNGIWESSAIENIQTDFTVQLVSFINFRNYWWKPNVSYYDHTWPAFIWGWRNFEIDSSATIYSYAHYNNCSIEELCRRNADGYIYVKYGIMDYSSSHKAKHFIIDALEREYNEVWKKSFSQLTLSPYDKDRRYMIDRFGCRWYYLSKETLYKDLLDPYRRFISEKSMSMLKN